MAGEVVHISATAQDEPVIMWLICGLSTQLLLAHCLFLVCFVLAGFFDLLSLNHKAKEEALNTPPNPAIEQETNKVCCFGPFRLLPFILEEEIDVSYTLSQLSLHSEQQQTLQVEGTVRKLSVLWGITPVRMRLSSRISLEPRETLKSILWRLQHRRGPAAHAVPIFLSHFHTTQL